MKVSIGTVQRLGSALLDTVQLVFTNVLSSLLGRCSLGYDGVGAQDSVTGYLHGEPNTSIARHALFNT